MIKKIVFVIIFILCSYDVFSQIPEIKVTVDTNNVLIGDQIKVELEVKDKSKFNVIWTPVPDSLGNLELINRGKIDTIKSENSYSIRQNLLVTSFDGGTFPIPSFTFTFAQNDNAYDTVFTEPLYLKFNSVEVDTTQEIKDIKGPLDVPIDWTEYLIYFVILLAILIALYFGYRFWKKRKQTTPDLGYDPSIPPSFLALEALKQLESEKLWQSGYVKKYHIRLTDIVRIYIERQFKIMAMEMVTPEIISELRKNNFEQGLINDMSELFSIADFVKFAKHQPLPDENTKCMNFAINFVNVSSKMNYEGDDNLREAKDGGEQLRITNYELRNEDNNLREAKDDEKQEGEAK